MNAQGANRWFAQLQAGFNDFGNKIDQVELHSVALKMVAAQDLYHALKDVALSPFEKGKDGKIILEISQQSADNIILALNKALGKVD